MDYNCLVSGFCLARWLENSPYFCTYSLSALIAREYTTVYLSIFLLWTFGEFPSFATGRCGVIKHACAAF